MQVLPRRTEEDLSARVRQSAKANASIAKHKANVEAQRKERMKREAKRQAKRQTRRKGMSAQRAKAALSAQRGVLAAQRGAEEQNLERKARALTQKSKETLRRKMQELAYQNLDQMAEREMARQHAINSIWPHPMGWSLQSATITGASSPVAVAADIQPPPLPPVEAQIVKAGTTPVTTIPKASAPSAPAPAANAATPMAASQVAAQTATDKKIPWPLILGGVGLLLVLRR